LDGRRDQGSQLPPRLALLIHHLRPRFPVPGLSVDNPAGLWDYCNKSAQPNHSGFCRFFKSVCRLPRAIRPAVGLTGPQARVMLDGRRLGAS
jgi:hypothetical protein